MNRPLSPEQLLEQAKYLKNLATQLEQRAQTLNQSQKKADNPNPVPLSARKISSMQHIPEKSTESSQLW